MVKNHEKAHRKLMADVIGLIQGRIIPKIPETFWDDSERLRAIQLCPSLLDEIIMQGLRDAGVRMPSEVVSPGFFYKEKIFVLPAEASQITPEECRRWDDIVLAKDFCELFSFCKPHARRIVMSIVQTQWADGDSPEQDLRRSISVAIGELETANAVPSPATLCPGEFVWCVHERGVRASASWYVALAQTERPNTECWMAAHWSPIHKKWHFYRDAPNGLFEARVLFPRAYA